MKTERLTLAVVAGAIALATLFVGIRFSGYADTILGFGAVLALVALGAMDYGINRKRLLER